MQDCDDDRRCATNTELVREEHNVVQELYIVLGVGLALRAKWTKEGHFPRQVQGRVDYRTDVRGANLVWNVVVESIPEGHLPNS